WDFEHSALFTDAERAALRLALAAGQSPSAATSEHFEELRKCYSEDQIVAMVGVIAFMGFLNRWNDTLATDLEEVPLTYGSQHLADGGWTPGKHAMREAV